jgi:hypothetical protein
MTDFQAKISSLLRLPQPKHAVAKRIFENMDCPRAFLAAITPSEAIYMIDLNCNTSIEKIVGLSFPVPLRSLPPNTMYKCSESARTLEHWIRHEINKPEEQRRAWFIQHFPDAPFYTMAESLHLVEQFDRPTYRAVMPRPPWYR